MLRDLPKVLLHDHLDGGLRPETVLDLASAQSYEGLPAVTPPELAEWFLQSRAGSLETYLEAFVHTTAVMQTESALRRVAYEAVLDYAASGVVYAEPRFAPSLHSSRGLTGQQIVLAVLDGLMQGSAETGVEVRLVLAAMRDRPNSLQTAELAVEFRDDGVVGFDLTGPERGYPASDHRAACQTAARGSLGLTIHAGEGDGIESIAGALDSGANRLGHGVRVVEDCVVAENSIGICGPTASLVRAEQIALEICLLSEIHTGTVPTGDDHPVGLLHRSGFVVTINTDNRLMSGTDMVTEFELLASHQGFSRADFLTVTEHAVAAAFCDDDTKKRLLSERIWPGYEL
ncbi:MAG: adenosine deaminase [Acidimicrobiia bacterium]